MWRKEEDGVKNVKKKSMQIKKVFRPINPKNIKNLSADVPSLFCSPLATANYNSVYTCISHIAICNKKVE